MNLKLKLILYIKIVSLMKILSVNFALDGDCQNSNVRSLKIQMNMILIKWEIIQIMDRFPLLGLT